MISKKQFPIFENNFDLIYLDNAATTQKPKKVIDRMNYFYTNENSNINRGLYSLSENASRNYDLVRKKVAKFINADHNEIVFTKGTTESINLLAYTIDSLVWEKKNGGKNEIVLTEMEHHSNIVPWMQLEKAFGFKIKIIPIKKDLSLDYEVAKKIINKNTAIVSLTFVSNTLGTINDVKKFINLSKKNGALTIIDATQATAHIKVDVKKIGCDFLVFSSHKMFGPLGVGVLYGKYDLLLKLRPFNFGGDMVNLVNFDEVIFQDPPNKFEAGTPNISGVIGFGEAIGFIEEIGINKIYKYELNLRKYTYKKLKSIKGITFYNPKNAIGIISFNLRNIPSHDVASILNDYNIAVRAGQHCTMPLMNKLNISGTVRISLSIYNDKKDIDSLIIALKKCQEIFSK